MTLEKFEEVDRDKTSACDGFLQAGHGLQRLDCLAGHVRHELRNVVADPRRSPQFFRPTQRLSGGDVPTAPYGGQSTLTTLRPRTGIRSEKGGCCAALSRDRLRTVW